MSPEQAAGKRAVLASDQFSFGTILYEMVTGRRAWKRNTAAETLTAIIREDPPPIASAAPGTPTALRWIIDRCLAKDPEERYASTRDLARDLATLRDHLGEVSGAGRPGRGTPAGPRRAPAAGARFSSPSRALRLIGAGILLAPLLRKPALPDWIQVGFRRGIVWSGRFAPDGQTIVYSAAWDGGPVSLFSTRLASTETRTLDLPPGQAPGDLAVERARFPARRALRPILRSARHPRAGPAWKRASGRDILENVQAADWSPDGTQLAVAREVDGKVRLEYPIGKTLYETDRPISNLRISRDGAWIAFCEGGGEVTVEALRVSDGLRKSSVRGLVSQRRWARLVRRRPRDLVHAAETGAGQQSPAHGRDAFGKAERGRPGSRASCASSTSPRTGECCSRAGTSQLGVRGSPPGHGPGPRALRHR